MRIAILTFAIALSGCATQATPYDTVETTPQVACTADGVLEEGRQARGYPANCPENPALIEPYRLGATIAALEEELRAINYRIASRDNGRRFGGYRGFYGGFGSSGYLIGRRVEIKNTLRTLKRQAGIA